MLVPIAVIKCIHKFGKLYNYVYESSHTYVL